VTLVALSQDSGSSRWATAARMLASVGFVAVVGTAAFADYLSSWLPAVRGFPTGAILRDGFAISFVCLAGVVLFEERSRSGPASLASPNTRGSGAIARPAFLPYMALSVWVLLLVLASPTKVPVLLAARNLLLYTLVGFAAYALFARRSLNERVLLGTLTTVGFVAAGLGILDTATHGGIVTSLGYRPDYSGIEGSASRLIAGASAAFQGYVRASGGISNALVFGYLMAAMAVFGTWMLERAVMRSGWRSRPAMTYLALGIAAGLACVDSLTRGALIALLIGLLLLAAMRRSRPIFLGSVVTVGMALALTLATSGIIAGSSAGSGTFLGLLDTVGARVSSSDQASQESTSLRVDQIRAGLQGLVERPMGNGLGTEGAAADRSDKAKVAPDVFVLIVALQTGIVGVGLYALIFLVMLISAARRPTQGNALAVAMIGIFGISAVLSASPDAPAFATTIWILMLAASAVRAEPATGKAIRSSGTRDRAASRDPSADSSRTSNGKMPGTGLAAVADQPATGRATTNI